MVARSLTRHPITINGITYQMSPLDDIGHDSLDEWAKAKYVESTAAILAKVPEADKALAYKVAYQEAAHITFMSDYGSRLMRTVEGVAQLLYEGIRRNHPEVTPEFLRKALIEGAGSDNIEKVTAAFEHLNLPDEKESSSPKAARLARRKRPSPKKKSTKS
jgi:hypothetical protein